MFHADDLPSAGHPGPRRGCLHLLTQPFPGIDFDILTVGRADTQPDRLLRAEAQGVGAQASFEGEGDRRYTGTYHTATCLTLFCSLSSSSSFCMHTMPTDARASYILFNGTALHDWGLLARIGWYFLCIEFRSQRPTYAHEWCSFFEMPSLRCIYSANTITVLSSAPATTASCTTPKRSGIRRTLGEGCESDHDWFRTCLDHGPYAKLVSPGAVAEDYCNPHMG